MIVRAAGATIVTGIERKCGFEEQENGRLDHKKARELDLGDVCRKVWVMTHTGVDILTKAADCSKLRAERSSAVAFCSPREPHLVPLSLHLGVTSVTMFV